MSQRTRTPCLRKPSHQAGTSLGDDPRHGTEPRYRCSMRRSASMMFLRISLIRVRWPAPLDFSQASTLGSRRTLTAISKSMSESSPAACFAAWRRSVRRSSSLHFLFLISPEVLRYLRLDVCLSVMELRSWNSAAPDRPGIHFSGNPVYLARTLRRRRAVDKHCY